MTNLPNTEQHRIQNIEHGRRDHTRGVVIHVMDGTLDGTLSWWKDTSHEADGAHVCVGLKKRVQTADLDAVCWHAPGDDVKIPGTQDGNHEFIGIEHQGGGKDSRAAWIKRRKQRVLSANACAWVCYHYGLGQPKWNVNVGHHSDFPQGNHPCPGPGFPDDLYIQAAVRAYNNLRLSNGKRWTRIPLPKRFSR